jgi:hypothetical protein
VICQEFKNKIIMQTHKAFLLALAVLASTLTFGQATGNYDWRAASNYSYQPQQVIPGAQPIASIGNFGEHYFSIKGLFNCKADSYLAIFAVTQVGATQAEADNLLREKIDAIKTKLKESGANAELFVDMVMFQPIYEMEVTKKIFSKKTYNEVPKGFELKKNLHFRYKSGHVLDDLVTLCAEQEIYDLVRVDYFVDNIEAKRAEMVTKAEALLKAKMGRYKTLLNEDWTDKFHQMSDGFAMTYPMEQYKSYQTTCSNSLAFTPTNPTGQHKSTSQFYMPKMAKGYDFVINPSLLEPVVQLEYEIVMRLTPKPKEAVQPVIKTEVKTEIKKEIYLITSDGQVKTINF